MKKNVFKVVGHLYLFAYIAAHLYLVLHVLLHHDPSESLTEKLLVPAIFPLLLILLPGTVLWRTLRGQSCPWWLRLLAILPLTVVTLGMARFGSSPLQVLLGAITYLPMLSIVILNKKARGLVS